MPSTLCRAETHLGACALLRCPTVRSYAAHGNRAAPGPACTRDRNVAFSTQLLTCKPGYDHLRLPYLMILARIRGSREELRSLDHSPVFLQRRGVRKLGGGRFEVLAVMEPAELSLLEIKGYQVTVTG